MPQVSFGQHCGVLGSLNLIDLNSTELMKLNFFCTLGKLPGTRSCESLLNSQVRGGSLPPLPRPCCPSYQPCWKEEAAGRVLRKEKVPSISTCLLCLLALNCSGDQLVAQHKQPGRLVSNPWQDERPFGGA